MLTNNSLVFRQNKQAGHQRNGAEITEMMDGLSLHVNSDQCEIQCGLLLFISPTLHYKITQ